MSSPTFDAVAVKALETAAAPASVIWLQDTDWNNNGVLDREETFKASNGNYPTSVKPVYDLHIEGVDANELLSSVRDVFAYAEVEVPCVADIDGNWYAVTDMENEEAYDKTTFGFRAGTKLSDIKSLHATYYYDFGDDSPTRLALGTNVAFAAENAALIVDTAEHPRKTLVIVHAQVYDWYGYNPYTANDYVPLAERKLVHTKSFTANDKNYLTNYVANVLGVPEAYKYALSGDYTDTDPVANGRGDGIPDGWELYVMFGTNHVRTATAAELTGGTEIHSPWNYADRTLDLDGDGLDLLHEYDGGIDPTDPWNAYTLYGWMNSKDLLLPGTAKFTDGNVYSNKFALTYNDYLSDEEFDVDDDNDQLTNLQELQAYLYAPTELADLSAVNAWSDGATPDYFRASSRTCAGPWALRCSTALEPMTTRAPVGTRGPPPGTPS